MAKTLKDFLEGYLKVKSADEQKFIDKHVTAKNPDRNGNGDDVFKGNTKPIDRRKDRKGYNPGEDEKVYEELKGKQHKIDANKNGKLDAHDFELLRKKKKVAEEAEELEELSIDTMKSYGDKRARTVFSGGRKPGESVDAAIDRKSKQSNMLSLARTKINRVHRTGSTVNKESVEALDELSPSTMGSYAKKASSDFTARKPKMGYDGQLKKMQNRRVGVNRALDKMYGEEAEQIDELSHDTLRRYRMKAKSIGDNEKGDINYRAKGRELAGRKTYGGRMAGIEKAKVMAKEETENLDETAKIVAHLQKRYGDNIRKSHVRSAASDFGVDASKLAKAVRTKLGKNMLDEKLNMDKASMGDVITDFKDSNAPQFKGKSPAKRRVMAIAAKLTAERGGKPLNKEERLQNRLADISESHQRVMLEVFDKLNEDNKSKFFEACSTPDGIEQMLDFAIRHRGE